MLLVRTTGSRLSYSLARIFSRIISLLKSASQDFVDVAVAATAAPVVELEAVTVVERSDTPRRTRRENKLFLGGFLATLDVIRLCCWRLSLLALVIMLPFGVVDLDTTVVASISRIVVLLQAGSSYESHFFVIVEINKKGEIERTRWTRNDRKSVTPKSLSHLERSLLVSPARSDRSNKGRRLMSYGNE
jgi:hypothetical protein